MFFWSLSNAKSKGSAHVYVAREAGKFGHVLAEKKVTIMINEFKYGQTSKI